VAFSVGGYMKVEPVKGCKNHGNVTIYKGGDVNKGICGECKKPVKEKK
jgi:hypothetical protein